MQTHTYMHMYANVHTCICVYKYPTQTPHVQSISSFPCYIHRHVQYIRVHKTSHTYMYEYTHTHPTCMHEYTHANQTYKHTHTQTNQTYKHTSACIHRHHCQGFAALSGYYNCLHHKYQKLVRTVDFPDPLKRRKPSFAFRLREKRTRHGITVGSSH